MELIKREIEKRHPEVKTQKWQSPPEQQQEEEQELNGKPSATTEALEDEKKCTTQKHTRQMSVHEPYFSGVNAILIDFFLYDTMKSLETEGTETIPHHRTRSIWY